MTDLGPLETMNPELRGRLSANGASLLDSVSKEHEKQLLEKKQKLANFKSSFDNQSESNIEINFGGICLEVDRKD